MLNTTLAGGTPAEVSTSAVFDPETNLMTVRLRSAEATTLSLRLSTQLPSACSGRTSCMADLPMLFATAAPVDEPTDPTADTDNASHPAGAALTMTRLANHWVNNEAALVECDPALHPTVGQREFELDPKTGAVVLRNVSFAGVYPPHRECLAELPAENRPYPPSVRHAPATDTIVSRAPCSSSGGGWVLAASGELKHSGSGKCAVYSTTNWSAAVIPADCAAAAEAGLGTKWTHDATTGQLSATAWAPAPGSVVRDVPQAVPHCLLSPIANVNVSLGMAVLLRHSPTAGAPTAPAVQAVPGSAGAEPYAAFAAFPIDAGVEYVLHVSIETTRRAGVPVREL